MYKHVFCEWLHPKNTNTHTHASTHPFQDVPQWRILCDHSISPCSPLPVCSFYIDGIKCDEQRVKSWKHHSCTLSYPYMFTNPREFIEFSGFLHLLMTFLAHFSRLFWYKSNLSPLTVDLIGLH